MNNLVECHGINHFILLCSVLGRRYCGNKHSRSKFPSMDLFFGDFRSLSLSKTRRSLQGGFWTQTRLNSPLHTHQVEQVKDQNIVAFLFSNSLFFLPALRSGRGSNTDPEEHWRRGFQVPHRAEGGRRGGRDEGSGRGSKWTSQRGSGDQTWTAAGDSHLSEFIISDTMR